MFMTRGWAICLLAGSAIALTGCSSLLAEGSSAAAGIAGGALASAVTDNAGVATGIGIAVQAATRSGVQYAQRKVHGDAQRQIAQVAGPLGVGQVQRWRSVHPVALEAEEAGRVAVSRVISTGELDCKEIVFSIDRAWNGLGSEAAQPGAFYVAAICRNGAQWEWASAEPATARWGALQ